MNENPHKPPACSALAHFHPAVRDWFTRSFGSPTQCQSEAWAAIARGRHALVAAPTGSGKTLAAFLGALDTLVREGLQQPLSDTTRVLYVSPLKALSNDIQRNLERPLMGISDCLNEQGLPAVGIRAMVRTGDTPQSARDAMRRVAPHILVTTPESLYILLTSDSGRRMLGDVQTVIVDEIHALASSKRGAHLMLCLERLDALTARPSMRIGLSATQKPIKDVARFLVGNRNIDAAAEPDCTIVDTGHVRRRDLALEVPPSPLEGVMSAEVWAEIYERLLVLIAEHRTTLIFVNTRRLAERIAHALTERLGAEHVTSHHGSLAKEQRLDAEQRLKSGRLKALVATASLELGIDIGDVDLVCQISSPRAISTFLQRVGRSGHAVNGTPKGRLFPLSRDDLVECAALLDAVQRQELDQLIFPHMPLDVLSQQLVAMCAAEDWDEEALWQRVRGAWSYRDLDRATFTACVRMLADGYATRRGRRGAYLHRDAVNHRLHARRGARLTAITNGGAIPDNADFDVVLEPQGTIIGTLNEDFAIESMAGDIFLLGNYSWRILRIESGKVRVADANGQPPNIPFWLGEAPGRTDELSAAVARLRAGLRERLENAACASVAAARDDALHWLQCERGLGTAAAEQLLDYLGAALAALGALPDHDTVVLERFFDDSGGMQLVVHSCFGSRINKAWGLALRKRFCRAFNFELQAAANEDSIILSLGETHSFPLADAARFLSSASVREVLIQALLDAPLFDVRWRWNANISLAVPRFRGGKKVPPQIQRMQAEDLVAVVFPDQIACLENISGPRQVPDHPLVRQTVHDALTAAMDIEGLEGLLRRIEAGALKIVARDLTEPSPLAAEILTANPYAFLDDAPAEERRTRAVSARRHVTAEDAAHSGRISGAAIRRVRAECAPGIRDADELHDALVLLSCMTAQEVARASGTDAMLDALARDRRAARVTIAATGAAPGIAHAGGAAELEIPAVRDTAALPDPGPESGPESGPDPVPKTRQKPGQVPIQQAGQLAAQQHMFIVAAERWDEFRAVYPHAIATPAISAPPGYEFNPAERDRAIIELLRARMQSAGPITAAELSGTLALPASEITIALTHLESEGVLLRGDFGESRGAGMNADEHWCERRLLARIHRYSLATQRERVRAVSSGAFMRFLLDWQFLSPNTRLGGPAGLARALDRLDGVEAPAACWESELLPARLLDFDPGWLDHLCLAGRAAWLRIVPTATRSKPQTNKPLSNTPIALTARSNMTLFARSATAPSPNGLAVRVLEHLELRGACFFDELVAEFALAPMSLEQALIALVANGQVTCDGFAGLRALISRRSAIRMRAHHLPRASRLAEAGRWSRIAVPARPSDPQQARLHELECAERVARVLLVRYGVLFKRLLEREISTVPWRDLLRCLRRMEARGEIRGGHFVDGFAGEQFALPEAARSLALRRDPAVGEEPICVYAADPMNLTGIITPGERVPARRGNRVLYRDGVPIAARIAKELQQFTNLSEEQQWQARLYLFGQTPGHPAAAHPNLFPATGITPQLL